jgi:hypothetical protein
MKTENVEMVLRNVRVNYAKVIRPGAAYEEGKPDEWSVNMYVTAEDAAKLKAQHVTGKLDRDGAEYFVAKRASVSKKGDKVSPPQIVDGGKNLWNGGDIGNGSVCNVKVALFPWAFKNRRGVYVYLQGLQVVNHVPYTSGGVDAFDVVDTAGAEEPNDLPW